MLGACLRWADFRLRTLGGWWGARGGIHLWGLSFAEIFGRFLAGLAAGGLREVFRGACWRDWGKEIEYQEGKGWACLWADFGEGFCLELVFGRFFLGLAQPIAKEDGKLLVFPS